MIGKAFDGIIFKLHGMVLAVDALKVREVVGRAEWQPAEEENQNFIHTRGRLIPVIDLRRLFGFSSLSKDGLNSFIAVQAAGADRNQLSALWVDSLLEMIHVPQGGLKAVPGAIGGVSAHFLQAVFEKDGEPVYVIQTDEIVREEFSGQKELDKAAS
jgi:purine-binding chemotaxis protein CheW